MVAREMDPPISRGFRRALQEMNLGIPVETALTAMGHRAGNEDLDLMVTAVLIQRQVGGNLAEILDTIAETIRERVRIQGEIKTLTAQGRISGVIIRILPVAIGAFIGVLNPSYLSLLIVHPMGKSYAGHRGSRSAGGNHRYSQNHYDQCVSKVMERCWLSC